MSRTSRTSTQPVYAPYTIAHPLWMLCFLVLTAVTFSLFGFIIGLWAETSRSCRWCR